MTSSISAKGLSSTYIQLINDTITSESQPVERLRTKKSDLTVLKSVYTDLKSKLDTLVSSVNALQSSDALSVVSLGRKVTASTIFSGATIATATATSDVVAGAYTIDLSQAGTQLAKAATTKSNKQTSGSAALGKTGSFTIDGVTIDVTSEMSLNAIAKAINAKTFEDGKGVNASVVDNKLVLQHKNQGADYSITIADTSGTVAQDLGLLDPANITAGRNAKFYVNDTLVERSSNSNLTDVVFGMTINLAADAEGKSTTLTVSSDSSSLTGAINTFITNFNETQTYLRNKTATVKNEDNTYTRNALAGETIYRTLMIDMNSAFAASYTNSGQYKRLSDIGITMDSDLKVSVSDSSKLSTALSTNFNDVKALLDSVMGGIENKLGSFTGTNGYVNKSITTATKQMTSLDSQITTWNNRLTKRQEYLVQQYLELQNQLTSLSYESQTISAINSSMSSLLDTSG